MFTLVELLQELKDLATGDDPKKLARINDLFANPNNPAEFQVGRHYVAHMLSTEVTAKLDSLDPSDRKHAVTTAKLVFPRAAAARALRRVLHDPDVSVRSYARRTASVLGLTSTAPPDVRFQAGKLGRFATTGWAFGIFASVSPRPKPKRPARADAVKQFGLPALPDRAAVAALVGVAPAELAKLMRPGVGAGSGYIEFEIAKAKGGTRRIAAPRKPLRTVQRTLLDKILAKVPVHEACHGFVTGRSTVTNATPHARAALVVKLDLKDFFPSVHYRRVRGLFTFLGYSADVANLLAGLTTYRPKLPTGEVVWPGVLPQGAPTSPAIANLTCRRLDQRLARLAAKFGATYTRYADDLTFSFAQPPEIRIGRFLWFVDAICEQEGFLERPDKRRILRAKHQQRVTGIVVNAGVHVPRADRKRFRAILHNCKQHGVASQANGRTDFAAYLAGYAAYVHMVEPALGTSWVTEVARLLGEAHG
ncbi:MAG TPA: reverse transcriptase family protein [Kofleriaceae bacterium]|nr:reverse transcriptase family protein [Kofleriaceae bacterium]